MGWCFRTNKKWGARIGENHWQSAIPFLTQCIAWPIARRCGICDVHFLHSDVLVPICIGAEVKDWSVQQRKLALESGKKDWLVKLSWVMDTCPQCFWCRLSLQAKWRCRNSFFVWLPVGVACFTFCEVNSPRLASEHEEVELTGLCHLAPTSRINFCSVLLGFLNLSGGFLFLILESLRLWGAGFDSQGLLWYESEVAWQNMFGMCEEPKFLTLANTSIYVNVQYLDLSYTSGNVIFVFWCPALFFCESFNHVAFQCTSKHELRTLSWLLTQLRGSISLPHEHSGLVNEKAQASMHWESSLFLCLFPK